MVSGEKRNCEAESIGEKTTAILLDIEGTTTSISFVKDTLFPYVRENLNKYIDTHWNDEELKADIQALKHQAKKDEEEKVENFCPIIDGDKESLIKNILWQMDHDRKTTALKQLQGHIWREGYENGQLKGHIYSDVASALKKWCEEGRKVYIYSSGSVEAQKLLFKNSESGDLETYLSGHFDSEVGPKTEASSYTAIAKAMGCESDQILFLTDVVKEATAADKAGMQVTIVIRDGNNPLTDDEKNSFTTVTSFKDLILESSYKKKKISQEGQEIEKSGNVGKSEPKDEKTELMDAETTNENSENNGMEKDFESNENKSDSPADAESPSADVDVESLDTMREDRNPESEKVVSSSIEDVQKEETISANEANEIPLESGNSADEEKRVEAIENGKENGENVNGHDNKEINNGSEECSALEESPEGVSLKKMAAEEPADSTVEVTA